MLRVRPIAPSRPRTSRQNDGYDQPGRSAERHVWSDRWHAPLQMKRECSQCGMSTEQWAILHRHPLDPEVPQQSVTPWLVRGTLSFTQGGELPAGSPASCESPSMSRHESGGSTEIPGPCGRVIGGLIILGRRLAQGRARRIRFPV